MRYALLVFEPEAAVKGRATDTEYQAAYKAYIEAIYGAGVAFAGSGLQDAATTSTTLRLSAANARFRTARSSTRRSSSPASS